MALEERKGWFYVGYHCPITGRWKRRSLNIPVSADNKPRALRAAARALEAAGKGVVDHASRPALDLLPVYLDDLRRRRCSAQHIAQREQQIKKLIAHAGAVTLAGLDEAAIARALGLMTQLSARTQNDYRAAAMAFFRFLVKSRIWDRNPVDAVAPVKELVEQKRRSLDPAELRALFAASPLRRRIVYVVMANTGIRPRELRQLRDADIDLEGRLVTVRAAISKTGEERTIQLPETTASLWRHWYTYVRQGLESQRRKRRGERSRYLKTPLPPLPMPRRWAKDIEAAGIDPTGLVLYCLRHSYATNLFRAGVQPAEVKRLMGHRRLETTLGHYVKLNQADDRGAAEALEKLMEGAAPEASKKKRPGAAS